MSLFSQRGEISRKGTVDWLPGSTGDQMALFFKVDKGYFSVSKAS
jgi:hypothetical protein